MKTVKVRLPHKVEFEGVEYGPGESPVPEKYAGLFGHEPKTKTSVLVEVDSADFDALNAALTERRAELRVLSARAEALEAQAATDKAALDAAAEGRKELEAEIARLHAALDTVEAERDAALARGAELGGAPDQPATTASAPAEPTLAESASLAEAGKPKPSGK